jgi:hypothetical protein
MGPQNPKDVARDIIRDLTGLVWEFSSMKEDAAHWLEGPAYGTLRHRLAIVHAAAEVALVEARRRVRLDEGWER